MARHRPTDDQWDRISDIFPPPANTGRRPVDRGMVMDGILWILRTGAPWRDLPEEFGKWGTVRDLFSKWNADGTLDEILRRLQAAHVDVGEIDEQLWCVDGTNVRAARCAAGAPKKGRSPMLALLATKP
jgi:transposase